MADKRKAPADISGDSPNRSGEDIVDQEGKEKGREDTGTKGASQRPVGTSKVSDMTGVDPKEQIT